MCSDSKLEWRMARGSVYVSQLDTSLTKASGRQRTAPRFPVLCWGDAVAIVEGIKSPMGALRGEGTDCL
eukprot:scaffold4545_cov103-Alexandrium_tamarense.AAC.23